MTRRVLCAEDDGLAAPLSRRIASLLGSGSPTATSPLACRSAQSAAAGAGVWPDRMVRQDSVRPSIAK